MTGTQGTVPTTAVPGDGVAPDRPVRVDVGPVAPGGVVLRPITDEDRPFLLDLYASTRAEELAVTPWSEAERRAFCDSQFAFQDASYRTSYPGARFDVVEVGGAPVGRLLVATGPREVEVLDIALVPGWRNRGLGTQLLRRLQADAAVQGRMVVLTVEPDGHAERLYRRLGFRLRTDGELHRELTWEAELVGAPALERFLDLAYRDESLRTELAGVDTDGALAHRAVALGLAAGLAFGPDEVDDVLRANRRAWFERGVR